MADGKPEPAAPSLLGVAFRDLARLHVVARAIVRHGFGELLLKTPLGRRLVSGAEAKGGAESRGSAAERFSALLGSLGPTFTKLGQILSVRRDLLSPAWIAALETLQDRAPELPYAEVVATVEASLGVPIGEAFEWFDERPLATASIAQTHRARTKDGADVVVKVQRPGIESVMRGDLDLLTLLAQVLEASVDEVQLIGVVDIVSEFERALLGELDFANELKNLLRMRGLCEASHKVLVPRPYPELSGQRVLTMSYFAGKSLRSLTPESARAREVVAELVRTMAKHILVDGFFHGDPHAGNLLVDDAGTLCMIDLGLVGTLGAHERQEIVTLVLAVMTNDTGGVARTLLRMGTPTERVQLEELRAEVARMRAKYLTLDVGALDTRGFAEEFAAAANRFRIKLASEYAILVKCIATAEGVVRTLDPKVDLVATIGPYVQSVVAERWSPSALLGELGGEASAVGSMLWRLPGQVDQLFHDFETGNLQLRAVTPELDTLPTLVHQAGSRVGLALFASTMAVCSALVLSGEPPPTYRIALCVGLGLLSAGAWLVLVVWHVVGRGKPLRLRPLLRALRAK